MRLSLDRLNVTWQSPRLMKVFFTLIEMFELYNENAQSPQVLIVPRSFFRRWGAIKCYSSTFGRGIIDKEVFLFTLVKVKYHRNSESCGNLWVFFLRLNVANVKSVTWNRYANLKWDQSPPYQPICETVNKFGIMFFLSPFPTYISLIQSVAEPCQVRTSHRENIFVVWILQRLHPLSPNVPIVPICPVCRNSVWPKSAADKA